MAVATNPSFDSNNQQLTKQPLYALTIEGIVEPLTTFLPASTEITWGGYGVAGYGTVGYGF